VFLHKFLPQIKANLTPSLSVTSTWMHHLPHSRDRETEAGSETHRHTLRVTHNTHREVYTQTHRETHRKAQKERGPRWKRIGEFVAPFFLVCKIFFY
jgi:hypothetical protein